MHNRHLRSSILRWLRRSAMDRVAHYARQVGITNGSWTSFFEEEFAYGYSVFERLFATVVDFRKFRESP